MVEFLTTKEVAALLRIKERTVYDLVKEGSIPVSRVTGKLLFPRELVEAWVRRNAETEGELKPSCVHRRCSRAATILCWNGQFESRGVALRPFSTAVLMDCRVSGKARLSHAACTSMNRIRRTGI